MTDDTRSDEVELGYLPTLGRRFLALTDEHESLLATMENAIEVIAADEGQGGYPLHMVYGPYRVGKSQFLYETFGYSWEHDVPAVFIPDPGRMLKRFEASGESSLVDWLQTEATAQIRAMVERDTDALSWFPDVPSRERDAWLDDYVPTDWSAVNTDHWVLIIDEVEQHFQALRKAVDVEDSNSLRVINDSLTDVLCFWSFGQLSAYEFQVQGDADRGRQVDLEIPPVTIDDVRTLLRKKGHPASLARFIWWASRGRAAWVYKLVTQLDGDEVDDPVEWLERLAEDPIAEVDLVRPIWTDTNNAYDDAIRTVAFLPDGYAPWTISDSTGIPVARMVGLLYDRLQTVEPLKSGSQRASQKLRSCLRRTVRALANEDDLLPQTWLSDPAEAAAFLEIAQNLLASFEPHSNARRIVYETLEAAKPKFSNLYFAGVTKLGSDDVVRRDVEVTAPSVVAKAFPSLALNPRRITDSETNNLYASMDRGLRVESHAHVKVVFCPTQRAYESELDDLRDAPDIATPNVLFVPEEVDVDLEGIPTTLEDFDVLRVREQDAARLWDFVVHLVDYARQKNVTDYAIDSDTVEALVADEDDHEIAQTIVNLYEQLAERVGDEAATGLWTDYCARFSAPSGTSMIWAHELITEPEWTNAPLHEQRFMTAFMFALGQQLDATHAYAALPTMIVDAGKEFEEFNTTKFKHTELANNGFTKAGDLSGPLQRLHKLHHDEANELIDSVENVLTLLSELAEGHDVSTDHIIAALDESETTAEQREIPIVGTAAVGSKEEFAWLRAALAATLLRDRSFIQDELTKAVEIVATDRKTVATRAEEIRDLSQHLAPPEGVSVGSSVELAPAYLDQLEANLTQMEDAATAVIERCETDRDFRMTAYGYLIFARRYAKAMDDAVSKLPSALLNQGDLTHVIGLRKAYANLDTKAREFTGASDYVESKDELIADVEALGNAVLDFEKAAGTDTIAVPDDRGIIDELTDKAHTDRQMVQQYFDDLERLTTEHQTKTARKSVLREGLTEFLARALSQEVTQ